MTPLQGSCYDSDTKTQGVALGYHISPRWGFRLQQMFIGGVMPQSLANVIVHVVFSTKDRAPLIQLAMENELHAYLATIANDLGCDCHRVGGVEDHVHLACSLSRTVPVADLVQELKQSSSKWMKTKGQEFQSFAWQNGYGAFSIGQSQLTALKNYITNQRVHHQRESYQQEYVATLRKYGIHFNEEHLWD